MRGIVRLCQQLRQIPDMICDTRFHCRGATFLVGATFINIRATLWGRGYWNCCHTPGARGCKLLGKSPRQLRWGTPPAAWRDPETRAAEPRQCADVGATNLTLSSVESHPRENVPISAQTNRFDHAPSPVRILMKAGVWLVPESERPVVQTELTKEE
jgi:hypothetical protein